MPTPTATIEAVIEGEAPKRESVQRLDAIHPSQAGHVVNLPCGIQFGRQRGADDVANTVSISAPTGSRCAQCGGEARWQHSAVRRLEMSEPFKILALETWLARSIEGYRGPVAVRRFSHGQSNPTYLLTTPERKYVLRKKPDGILLQSAHAVEREYRVMLALQDTGVPVPRILGSAKSPQSSAHPST